MANSQTRIASVIETSREELLDLGLRNPLLNYRPSRARGVEVVDELPVEVFRILVREGRPMSFVAAPEKPEDDDDKLLVQPRDEDGEGGTPDRHVDTRLQTNLASARLQSRLLKTERDARTFIEEQGVNILYLALGMLRWYEAESSQESRKAPLILVPVALERSNVRARFRLLYTEEEIEQNLPLVNKLRVEFGADFPEMLPQEELDAQSYFDDVEASIRHLPRWSVDRDAVALGFFSFGKLLMYRDLDEGNWPRGRGPADHPVIRTLFDDNSHESPSQLPEDEHLDMHVNPADVHQVVDADSSQTLALLDVKGGRSLVIQGPPGTGKSQTITNLIAEAVGYGKTVLFVAEKMAALEVVKRRLDAVGLGEACMELHSRKTNKRAVLQELERTIRLGRPMLEEAEDDLSILTDLRDRLNAYSEAMNAPIGESGMTPYRAIGELVRLGPEAAALPRLGFESMRDWSGTDFRRRQGLVEELQTQLFDMGVPSQNPFYGSTRTVLVPTEQARIAQALLAAQGSTRALRESAADLAATLGLTPPATRQDAETLCRAARRATEAPRLEGVRLRSGEWQARSDQLRTLIDAGEGYSEVRARYDETLIPEAWDQDLLETRQHLANYGSKWWRPLSGNYRQARDRLEGLCREPMPQGVDEQLALVDAVLEVQRHRKVLSEYETLGANLFGAQWQGERSDWPVLAGLLGWIVDLYREVGEGQLPEGLIDFLAGDPAIVGLEQKISTTEGALVDYGSAFDALTELLELAEGRRASLTEQPLTTLESIFEAWHRNLDRLRSLVTYNQLSETLLQEGLEGVLRQAESWPEAATGLVDAYRYTWFEGLVEQAFRERPALVKFDRVNHEYVAEKFRELDKLVIEHNRARLAHAHWRGVPTHEAGGQLGVLKREIQKKRRHLPIRQLVNRAGEAIQAIKPVFMMSPLSIANFLEPGALDFDLVVFDEASQVRPVEALGAIARGKQVVVVGDGKQLPPTSFFDRLVGAEDADEKSMTADLESVLGLFSAQGAPERMLRWHYRSRHESLITVSNHEFYEDRLVVFPSPDKGREDVGLVYHYLPDTVYDRGGTSSNVGEAKKVAEAVMEHARNRPHLTLGVAAFSTAQMQAIEDQLEILRRSDPSCEGFFVAHPYEPFFVKNLENVQGDERDVVFISVGYGRIAGGYVPMSFGPLNLDGGERRLNVLITRARRICAVFTNLSADDIDLGRSNARGVRALKTFLKYAKEGQLDVPVATGREPDSPFEESVLAALQRVGYQVETQVGSAGFFIDLAVVDPERPGRYLLGVECDGATYHSARSARDRDRLRQEVLESLGWRIHRIWSTDWFRNPEGEIKRLVGSIEEAKLYGEPLQENGHSTQDRATDIVRDEELASAEISTIPKYETADIRISFHGEFHQASPDSLGDVVANIVEVESPIHLQELSRRVTEAAYISRTGSRIRAVIEAAVRSAVRRRKVHRNGDFLWHPEMQAAPLRDRSELPNASKKLEFVASEEIEAAIGKVVTDAYGIDREEIPGAVLRLLLGFKRATEVAQRQVTKVLDGMIAQGRLIEENNHVSVKE
jgi:very-short-patch-repair endonuclease